MKALRRLRTSPGGQLDCRVSFSDGPGTSRPVAYVERELLPNGISAYLAARESGARSFVLWADEHRQARVATLVTVSAGSGRAQFKSSGDTVRLYAPELDWRLGAALAALIPSFDSWIGDPWDRRKD